MISPRSFGAKQNSESFSTPDTKVCHVILVSIIRLRMKTTKNEKLSVLIAVRTFKLKGNSDSSLKNVVFVTKLIN